MSASARLRASHDPMEKLYLTTEEFNKRLGEIQADYEARQKECAGDAGKLKLATDEMMIKLRRVTGIYERSKLFGLIAEANELDVDLPSPGEKGTWLGINGVAGDVPRLSSKGKLLLRRAVDEEKMRRREVAAWWWKTVVIPGITALIGLVGALTGLVAVLHHGK